MKPLLPLLLCIPFAGLFAQSSDPYIIATQGGVSKGETMTVSWTIGDVVTETALLNDGLITQGFQQPSITVREITPVTTGDYTDHGKEAQKETEKISPRNLVDFTAQVFPNPVGNDVTVQIENAEKEYYLDLFDPSGNLISRNRSRNPQEILNMSALPAAQYVLRVSLVDSQESKVFQIIKSR